MPLNVHTQKTFSEQIEKLVVDNPGLGYIEAIVEYTERNNMELERINRLLTPKLKDKIYLEATKLNFFPGEDYNPLSFLEDD